MNIIRLAIAAVLVLSVVGCAAEQEPAFAPDDLMFYLPEGELKGQEFYRRDADDFRIGSPTTIEDLNERYPDLAAIFSDVLRALQKEPKDLGWAGVHTGWDEEGRVTVTALRVQGVDAEELLDDYAIAAGWTTTEADYLSRGEIEGRQVVYASLEPDNWRFWYPFGEVLFAADGIWTQGYDAVITAEDIAAMLP